MRNNSIPILPAMKPAAQQRRSYAPNGVEGRKPVAMRLLPHEKSELEALAAKEDRSAGSLARLLYLRGLDAYRKDEEATRSEPARPSLLCFAQAK